MDKTPVHILLVEDSPTDADLLRRIFLGFSNEESSLTQVDRLTTAIAQCHENSYDVVLLDLGLPDCDGIETVTEFRANVPTVPVIVLTMMDDDELALQVMACGAQDYLIKDQITGQLLMRSIRYAIEREQISQQLRNSERSVISALAQQKELNLLKSSFISMSSHEFRTPMTIIRTSVELLQKFEHELTEQKKNDYFKRIKAAISQITHLLDEVLLLGSSEAGGLSYKPEPLNLEKFCSELLEDLQFSDDNHHSIAMDYQGDYANAVMDSALLWHILNNLVSNAIKYSPQGGTVRFSLTCQSGNAIFQVQDQGIGIPLKDQTHLFETFYRCSNVGKIQGTGLGLAIAKKCVDLHRGDIQVTSELGKGTVFAVVLPMNPTDSQ
ncbi:MAG: hybrid sensor histidine kinase/response regulator [Leptolyngbya sp.]|nr:MAG: hybrid sensor histidine kinase/response regulator [Leptolyngbya sp.]